MRTTRPSSHRLPWRLGSTALALLLAVLLLPAAARGEEAEDLVSDDEPELVGPAKKQHEKAVKALVKSLKTEKNQEIVRGRLQQLGNRPTRVNRDALMAYVVKNKNHEFVQIAFRSLADIGGKKAIEFLCGKQALRSRDFLVAHAAAEALAIAKDPRAIDPLLDVMTGKRTKIKVVAACAEAVAKSAPEDELALDVLFHFSEHRKDTIRAYVVEALGYLKTDRAVARLEEALTKDKNTRVREYAARGLGHTNRADVVPILQKALEEETAHTVRTACMYALRGLQGG